MNKFADAINYRDIDYLLYLLETAPAEDVRDALRYAARTGAPRSIVNYILRSPFIATVDIESAMDVAEDWGAFETADYLKSIVDDRRLKKKVVHTLPKPTAKSSHNGKRGCGCGRK